MGVPGVALAAVGAPIALDGDTGRLVIDPDPDTLVEFKTRAADRERRLDEALRAAHRPAVTRDGTEVHVAANVGSVADAAAAVGHGADLAGLIRTEFLFLSIGTNDLTQYALAAERGNDAVAALADPLDPGVLQLVDRVCRAASGSGVRVAVCGEVAADPVATPFLLGLGVAELSVVPHTVPIVKQAVRAVDLSASRELAARALALTDPDAVRCLG